MKGESITAASRTPSAAAESTRWRRAESAPSSLRIFQGSRATMKPLISVRNFQTASSARLNWQSRHGGAPLGSRAGA